MRSGCTLSIMRHSGTHLVKPILKRIIGKSSSGKGNTLLALDDSKPIVCTRDPRNRIVSSFRFKQFRVGGKPKDDDDVDKLLAAYIGNQPIIEFMHAWADRWMGLPQAHYIRFEAFLTEDTAIRTIAETAAYVGVDITEDQIVDIYRMFYKNSPTFTGNHSRWKEWFGEHTTLLWKERNGKQLVKKMGYK